MKRFVNCFDIGQIILTITVIGSSDRTSGSPPQIKFYDEETYQ